MRAVCVTFAAVALLLAGIPASGQQVISARSGLVSYVEGQVYMGNQLVDPQFGHFPTLGENAILRTQEGRAEMLLNPGVFLRLSENSSVKMITNRLIDTRLELLQGSAVVEADQIAKDNNVTLVANEAAISMTKAGVYRVDAEPGSLKVYSGDAQVQRGDQYVNVTGGKMLNLADEAASVQKFDTKDTDALDRWSERRGEYAAVANVSAAKSMLDNGGGMLTTGIWQWNPWYGMMTFIPAAGMLWSPYGYGFWSPVLVTQALYYGPPAGFGRVNNIGLTPGASLTNRNTLTAAPRAESSLGGASAARASGSTAPVGHAGGAGHGR
jgi:FecR protein